MLFVLQRESLAFVCVLFEMEGDLEPPRSGCANCVNSTLMKDHMICTTVESHLVFHDLFKSGMKSAADSLLGVGAPLHTCSDVMRIFLRPPLT